MGQAAVLRAALSALGTAQLLVLVSLQELARGGIHRTPCAPSIWDPYSTPIILCSLSASLTKGSKREKACLSPEPRIVPGTY